MRQRCWNAALPLSSSYPSEIWYTAKLEWTTLRGVGFYLPALVILQLPSSQGGNLRMSVVVATENESTKLLRGRLQQNKVRSGSCMRHCSDLWVNVEVHRW